MAKIFVKPSRPGLRVRHPEQPTLLIPEEGCEIETSSVVHRLFRSGDLVIVDKQLATKTSESK